MRKKKPHPDEKEQAEFRDAIGDAIPHRHDREEPFSQRPRPYPLPPKTEIARERPGDELVDLNIETGDELLFRRPGIQHRLFQELRRGHLPPEEILDLHGLRVVEARTALSRFLSHARHHRLRVIHIIHGKGYGSQERQPILKQKVNQWLRQRDEVLAFCSAPRFDGGTGAVYALLSRKAVRGDR